MSDHHGEGMPSRPVGQRLDSWKEIAAYLHRDVRTVQRWEKTAGLPVHRHPSKLRTTFAYEAELEAWWLGRRADLEPGDADAAPSVAARRLEAARHALIGAGLIVALLGGVLGDRPARSAAEREGSAGHHVRVLLTPVADKTGGGNLGALLDSVVADQFLRARGVEVAPPRLIARLLRLMRRDQGSLTVPVGREVCLRGGAIRALVAGSVHRVDERYAAVLELVNPVDGRILHSFQVDAASAGGLVDRARGASRRAAAAAAALPPDSTGETAAIEEVTTPSLGAARLYTAAVQAGKREEWAAAELLARRALLADGDFAAAAAWVAWAIARQGRPRSEFIPMASRAVTLAGKASDREAYLITGMYHALAGDVTRAAAAYEALRRVAPADQHVLDLLLDTYTRAGRVDAAATLAIAAAEARPEDFTSNARAARALLIWQGDGARAQRFVRRSLAAAPKAAADRRLGAWLRALPVFEHWLAGDLASAVRGVDAIERGFSTATSFRETDVLRTTAAFTHLALGRLAQADRVLREVSADSRHLSLALTALAVGEVATARDHLTRIPSASRRRPALFARVGLVSEAEAGIEAHLDSEYATGMTTLTRGLLADRRGAHDEALLTIERGVELLRFSGEPEYFLGIEELARLLERRGEADAAIRTLEAGAAQGNRTFCDPRWAGAFWLRVNVGLLASYERSGRLAEADALRRRLQGLLAVADSDHPLLAAIAGTGPRAGLAGPDRGVIAQLSRNPR